MSAVISECGKYRYRLDRHVGDGPTVALLGVNPSTADASINDATIRKDLGFAARNGWGRIIKGNKFAYRATDVKVLRSVPDAIGPENDAYLSAIVAEADIVVMCWGPLAKLPRELRQRWRDVLALVVDAGKPPHCFGMAQDGQPLHTLMLAYATPLQLWAPPR